MKSKELLDVDAFFVEFEKIQEELKQKDVSVSIAGAEKGVLGWYVSILIRPCATDSIDSDNIHIPGKFK
jgi:hypothetical protein